MNSKKLLLVLFSVLLAQGCNDSQQPDTDQSRASLECLTFQDTAFGIYAMTNWDVDHNGCLNESEAAQVTELPANAFAGNTTLQNLNDMNKFPNLTAIGSGAFDGCTGLVSADLTHIKTVGNHAFSDCTSLVSVRLPNASSISDNAFEGCTNLTNIVGPQTQNTCTGGALKCSDNNAQVLICMNSQWMTKEACANGCVNSACISDAPAPTCTKGTLKCSDDNAQVLMCKNNRWTSLAACANGCADGRCITTTPSKTCTEGALKCSDNGSQALVCVNDTWTAKETCAKRCENGVCVSEPPKVCNDGATKCSDDGKQALVCVNDTWTAKETCAERCKNGVCVSEPPKVCNDGATKCSDDGKEMLRCYNHPERGAIWGFSQTCAERCENGVCVSVSVPDHPCTEGTTRYNQYGHFFVCHNGAWIFEAKCASSGFLEDGTCYDSSQICDKDEEGSMKCSDNILISCQRKVYPGFADYRWDFYQNCGIYGCNSDTKSCNSSDCTKNGLLKCSDDNTHSLECKYGKWYWMENCPNGCEDGICIGSEDYCSLYAVKGGEWASPYPSNKRLRCSSDHKFLYRCLFYEFSHDPTNWEKYACDYCVDGLCLCKNGVASTSGNCVSEPQNDKCTPGETRIYCMDYTKPDSWELVASYVYKQTCTENDDKTTSFTFDHGKDVIKQCRYGCNDEGTDCVPEDNGFDRVRGCNGHDFGDILEYSSRYHFKQTVWEIPSDKYQLSYPFNSADALLAGNCTSDYGDPYDYCHINWGDGYSSTVVMSACYGHTGYTHTYNKAGTYTITTDCPFDLEFYDKCWRGTCSMGWCDVECEYDQQKSVCDLIPELVEIKDWSK